MKFLKVFLIAFVVLGVLAPHGVVAQESGEANILLTVFLKHDQSKNLDEIQSILKDSKFFEKFPPKGTKVISWYVLMGLGQVVTLEVPAAELREVNLAVETAGWKAYRSEFYPTYNLYPFIESQLTNKSVKCLNESSKC